MHLLVLKASNTRENDQALQQREVQCLPCCWFASSLIAENYTDRCCFFFDFFNLEATYFSIKSLFISFNKRYIKE